MNTRLTGPIPDPDTGAEMRALFATTHRIHPRATIARYGPAGYDYGAVVYVGDYVYIIEMADEAMYALGRYSSDTPENDRWCETALEFGEFATFDEALAVLRRMAVQDGRLA
jgi:phosphoglycolate phosphatase-like HAD superfamily hydrolase